MKKSVISIAILTATGLFALSGTYAATSADTSKTTAVTTTATNATSTAATTTAMATCSPNLKQMIQLINLLANTNYNPASRPSQFQVEYDSADGSHCTWSGLQTPINYQNFYEFGVGDGCGCVNIVSKIVIKPVTPPGQTKPLYADFEYPINTNNGITSTQIIVLQETEPKFDNQGYVATQGTIKVIKQEK